MHIFAYPSTRALGDFTMDCLWIATKRQEHDATRLTVCFRNDRPYKPLIAACIPDVDVLMELDATTPAPRLDQFDMSHGKYESGAPALDHRRTRAVDMLLVSSMFNGTYFDFIGYPAVLFPPKEMMAAARAALETRGLDTTRWFATVYWKEAGYELRGMNGQRVIADPVPYLEAIERILEAGGQVVRLGHPSAAKELDQAHGEVAHEDAGELIKMCEAILHLHKPDPKDVGKCPLALYFATDAERDGFIEAYRHHISNQGKMVKLP